MPAKMTIKVCECCTCHRLEKLSSWLITGSFSNFRRVRCGELAGLKSSWKRRTDKGRGLQFGSSRLGYYRNRKVFDRIVPSCLFLSLESDLVQPRMGSNAWWPTSCHPARRLPSGCSGPKRLIQPRTINLMSTQSLIRVQGLWVCDKYYRAIYHGLQVIAERLLERDSRSSLSPPGRPVKANI